MKKHALMLIFLVLSIMLVSTVLAHNHKTDANDNHSQYNKAGQNLTHYTIEKNSVKIIISASIIIAVFLTFSLLMHSDKKTFNKHKKLLFWGMVIPTIIASVYLASGTIYLNVISDTGGPVHWHADFEVWNCDEKLDLKDPTGLSNRIGTPVYHEHNDFRIHVEGVVIKTRDVRLAQFFTVIGGAFDGKSLTLPTNNGMVQVKEGNTCKGEPAEIQVFKYSILNPDDENWQFTQEKVENSEDYVLAPYSYVPPGDCVIIEFDKEKEKTDKICETYKIARDQGKIKEVTHGS
jgi:preprotein translocase subunit SecG